MDNSGYVFRPGKLDNSCAVKFVDIITVRVESYNEMLFVLLKDSFSILQSSDGEGIDINCCSSYGFLNGVGDKLIIRKIKDNRDWYLGKSWNFGYQIILFVKL